MVVDFISLAVIVVVAALCPIIASLIPNKLIPESVFLLIAGAVLGPNLLGVIQTTDVVNFLSELGLAYLFLLAGMEINPKNLVGHEGKRGIGAWGISLALGFVVVFLLPWFDPAQLDGIAVAIAMTTTAFGTLVPIMKERGLTGTPVGNSIMAYGTWGELAPIVAIALLLSTRSSWQTLLILGAFALIAVVMAFIPKKAKAAGSKIAHFVQTRSNTTYQTMVRFTMLILVLLLAISEIFHLDIVLGAFAAGFVMGAIIPEGDEELETKLNGAAYGFFIPLFFIVSGAKVNILAIGDNPVLLVVFIIALMMVRGIPVFIMLTTDKRCELSAHNRWTVALYCTTALPLVVAITSIGTSMGFFSQDTASVLVAAGAITVFLMPFLASLTYRVADAMPGEAIKEIRENPSDIGRIIRRHAMLEQLVNLEMAVDHLEQRKKQIAEQGDSCDIDEYKKASRRHAILADALKSTAAELAQHEELLDDASLREALQELRGLRREELRRRRMHMSGEEIEESRNQVVEGLARIAIIESRRLRDETSHKEASHDEGAPAESAPGVAPRA
ncbi:MAG: cation:proton antiporter [Coriobacteriaceae bacterium]|nr:cation:proton antiporter [Coriobacteriaceae bacterium]